VLIQTGNRGLYYDLIGPDTGREAAPVICFAHALSADSGIWAEQIPPLLAKGWCVLRLDMRGHGGSDAVPGDYTMSELADDVVVALDFLGLAKVHFVGLSIGGMIGQTFAIEHAHRLSSLMLSGTSPTGLSGGMQVWQARFDALQRAGPVDPLADATMERWFTQAFKPRQPGRWKQIRATIAATTPAGYLGGAAAIINFDVLSKLRTVNAPTLVVCGDGDTGTPPSGNRRIAQLVPGARYQEIADARHVPNVEHPDTFNRIMVEWLSAAVRR
jgi:3-oxoadipate enol-lactonase